MTKEITACKTKLDMANRHSTDLEEQLSKLQKENAKSEVEKNRVEKEVRPWCLFYYYYQFFFVFLFFFLFSTLAKSLSHPKAVI